MAKNNKGGWFKPKIVMKKIKYAALALLPVFALSACDKEEIHVSTPKEIITKRYDLNGNADIEKDVYQYDKKGNITFDESFVYNEETKAFEQSAKYEYTYDKNNNLTQFLQHDFKDGTYVQSFKMVYTFDDTKLVKEETYSLNAEFNLVLSAYSADYQYDSNNRNTSYSTYVLNTETKQFDKETFVTMEYKDNFEEFVVLEEINLLDEDMNMIITRELDEKGRIISEIGGVPAQSYIEAHQNVYNEDGELQGSTYYYVDSETGEYHLLTVEDYVYTNKHYLKQQYVTYLNNDGNLKFRQITENTYDDKMNILSSKEFEYDPETKKTRLIVEKTMSY